MQTIKTSVKPAAAAPFSIGASRPETSEDAQANAEAFSDELAVATNETLTAPAVDPEQQPKHGRASTHDEDTGHDDALLLASAEAAKQTLPPNGPLLTPGAHPAVPRAGLGSQASSPEATWPQLPASLATPASPQSQQKSSAPTFPRSVPVAANQTPPKASVARNAPAPRTQVRKPQAPTAPPREARLLEELSELRTLVKNREPAAPPHVVPTESSGDNRPATPAPAAPPVDRPVAPPTLERPQPKPEATATRPSRPRHAEAAPSVPQTDAPNPAPATARAFGATVALDAPSPVPGAAPSAANSAATAATSGSPRAATGPLPPETAQRIHDQLRIQLSPRRPEVTVVLDPPELGRLHLKLGMRDGALHARITADRLDVARTFEADVSRLHRTLEEAGIRVSDVEIRTALQDDRSSGPFHDALHKNSTFAGHAEARSRRSPNRDGSSSSATDPDSDPDSPTPEAPASTDSANLDLIV